ncbi:hypothetical protein [Sphingomonas sp.]|uniref:hypothetical protein n=1 Tax=Sphingomonas sp. TaxID=28214 RepID=UPI003B000824
MKKTRFGLMLSGLVSACGPAPAGNEARQTEPAALPSPTPPPVVPAAAPGPAATPALDYAGRWIGVEGMVLDVAPAAAADRYRLTMQYDLDHRATVDATREGTTLVFTRDGKRLTLRPTDGAATGLKYLADKKDCLTVVSGEGYCRD